ncbi:hypothetical protein I79_003871 [Cricetulus griseus]|uniref:Uncharacterized protein n=1 Tax=Cricetulus griseus TaxID=10029 RepID=G3H147_CRIGR|nr:hypothetical protein I79_003871 [Cricetulus griseus]
MQYPKRPGEGTTHTWAEVTRNCEVHNVVLGAKLGPLQEQCSLLTNEPYLQP